MRLMNAVDSKSLILKYLLPTNKELYFELTEEVPMYLFILRI
jgi:hypothetical protein